jgi:N-hydroxyarylamine O-acetyltransferase
MLNSYLQRIGYQGPQTPTLEALRGIHRQHVLSIAYENIDVVLQLPVDRSIEHNHHKLVTNQRGGWCYEMNGLLGWALAQIGFNVTQLSGGVMREEHGDATYGNHLLLRLDFDDACDGSHCWLADVGLGDGLLEPIPLVAGRYRQRHSNFTLVKLDEPTTAQTWRFVNRQGGLPTSFDFVNQTADPTLLDTTCATLQSDANSIFRRNLVVQRVDEQGAHLLLGRLYTDPSGKRELLESEADLTKLLTGEFNIAQPPHNGLWESVCNRHAELFGDTPADKIELTPRRPD